MKTNTPNWNKQFEKKLKMLAIAIKIKMYAIHHLAIKVPGIDPLI